MKHATVPTPDKDVVMRLVEAVEMLSTRQLETTNALETSNKITISTQTMINALNDANILHTKTTNKLINEMQLNRVKESQKWDDLMKAFTVTLKITIGLVCVLGVIALGEKYSPVVNELLKHLPI